MYLLITVMAALLVGLILVYLVHVVFDREPQAPGTTRAERREVRRSTALQIDRLNRELEERDRMIAELLEHQDNSNDQNDQDDRRKGTT